MVPLFVVLTKNKNKTNKKSRMLKISEPGVCNTSVSSVVSSLYVIVGQLDNGQRGSAEIRTVAGSGLVVHSSQSGEVLLLLCTIEAATIRNLHNHFIHQKIFIYLLL